MTFIVAILIAGTLACTTAAADAADDAVMIAKQYYPERLAAESSEDVGIAPKRLVDAEAEGRWIFAAYSNGSSGSVDVIERTSTGTQVVAESTLPNGNAPGVELLDLDADGTPEILASFADLRGTPVYWIYAWNGQVLQLVSATDDHQVDGVFSSITDPMFIDIDGNGAVEVIDHKIIDGFDDDGERTSESLYTVYALHNARLVPAKRVIYFGQFNRGTGKPARVEVSFAGVEGDYNVRLVNGSDAATAVTSGHVWINESAIFSPKDFKRSERIVVRPIQLAPGENVLAVQLNGEPDSCVWIFVESR